MIDLCIVSYNTLDKFQRLYNTLSASSTGSGAFAVHVADNGSTDGSREFLTWMNDTGLLNVDLNKNIGYARACNQLASYGEGDIVALLNSDIWFTEADLLAIQKIFDEDPEVGILGPKQRDEQGHIRHAGIFGTNTAPKHRGWNEPDPEDVLYRDKLEAVTVSGSAYFVRRSVWDDLTNDEGYQSFCERVLGERPTGAFLPTNHYYEETWCSYFARHKGYKVFYDGSVSIGHSWHASHEVGSPADQQFHISRKLFRMACDEMGIERD